MRRTVSRLPALLLVIALAGGLLAQGPRAAAEEYSDAALEAFATAAIEVSRVIEVWRPRIEGETDKDAQRDLLEDANAAVARAIEETEGISAEEFQAIYDEAREDEALRRRIDAIIAALLQRPRVPRAE